jgi:arginine-tRNA-protein transferase
MVVQYYYPQTLATTRLDAYLASGWFRNAYMMYRAKLICLNDDLFSVVNIRLKTSDYAPSKRLRKTARRCEKRFTTVVRPMLLDQEKEKLYQNHKSRFEGFIYGSLKHFFYGEIGYHKIFNTHEVCVYDGNKLIAVSFFDFGKNSCASLLAVYDKSYTKVSLGTFTMMKEIEYCVEQGLENYYPGYVLDKSSVFDYKLKMGEMQYYNWRTKRWRKWQSRSTMPSDAEKVKTKIELVKEGLRESNVEYKEYMYPLFSVGYLDSYYVRSPIFVSCHHEDNEDLPPRFIIEYWLDEDCFTLSTVQKTPFVNNPDMMEISDSFYSEHNYFDLLMYKQVLITSAKIDDIIRELFDYPNDYDFYDESFGYVQY